jgi:hypothetical protein
MRINLSSLALLVTVVSFGITQSMAQAPISRRMEYSNNSPVEVGDTIRFGYNPAAGEVCALNLVMVLGVNHNFPNLVPGDLDVEARFSVTLNNGVPLNYTFHLNYSALNLAFQSTDRHLIETSGAQSIIVELEEVTINSVGGDSLPDNFYLDATLFPNCIENLDYNWNSGAHNLEITANMDCDLDETIDELLLSWDEIDGATGYHLEWTFVNNYGEIFDTNYRSANELYFDFRANSTRVSTVAPNYTIPNLFDHGYVIFRVRPLGVMTSNPDHVFPGNWSLPEYGLVSSAGSAQYEIDTPFESSINWQVTTTFAEEGKKKEVASFFDGSQRNRQTITRLNTENNVVVGETIYDYEGRPVINVLPTPVLEENCELSSDRAPLAYYPLFNQVAEGQAYDRSVFDQDTDACEVATPPLYDGSGASQYYSPLNPWLNTNPENAFIPDANGYPMTQVEYTPDNTGRIRSQSGVGPEFQLGNNHETKYFYGSPYQIQLDRLFGSEVGNASHYQKNMVLDPNRQISVSYLDMEGRTIATSLAGQSPQNLEQLTNYEEQVTLTVDLFNEDANGESDVNIVTTYNSIEFSKTILVVTEDEYYFNYNLSIDTLALPCEVDLCVHCVYDLELSLEDECGNNLLNPGSPEEDIHYPVGYLVESDGSYTFNTDCNVNNAPDVFQLIWDENDANADSHVLVNLLPGSYTIRKTLRINEEARDFYLNTYLEQAMQSGCIDSLGTFIAAAIDSIDYSDCNISCQDCVNSLGTRDEWIAQGGTGEEWDAAYLECIDPCDDYINPCEMTREMMLADMTPGGQYATFHTVTPLDADGLPLPTQYIVTGAPHHLSVLNQNNLLPDEPVANWKNPYNPLVENGLQNAYYDEYGVRSVIYLTLDENNVYEPLVDPGFIYFDDNGEPFTYPEHLQNVEDFIAAFEQDWAKSLLYYHPEYCYYEVCLSYGPAVIPGETFNADTTLVLSPDIVTSQQFDRLLANTWDVSTAISRGLLQSNGQPTDWFNGSQPNDPFTAIGSFDSFGQDVISRWNNYANGYTLPQFAAFVNRCGDEIGNPNPPASCLAFGTTIDFNDPVNDELLRDQEWVTLTSLYASVKAEVQREYGHHYVIEEECGSFNECFGEDYWSPYSYPRLCVG